MAFTSGETVNWETEEICTVVESIRYRENRQSLGPQILYDSWYQIGVFSLESGKTVRKIPSEKPKRNKDKPIMFEFS